MKRFLLIFFFVPLPFFGQISLTNDSPRDLQLVARDPDNNNGIIPINFEDLVDICDIGEIFTEEHYERAMNISLKLMLIDDKSEDQKNYLDKITNYIVTYEDKMFDF